MNIHLAQFFEKPNIDYSSGACPPRNAWESFTSDLGYHTVKSFSDGVAIVVVVLLLAAVAAAVTRHFRNSLNHAAVYAMAMSGVAACALSFGLMRHPGHEPYLIGIGASLAVGALVAATSAIKCTASS